MQQGEPTTGPDDRQQDGHEVAFAARCTQLVTCFKMREPCSWSRLIREKDSAISTLA